MKFLKVFSLFICVVSYCVVNAISVGSNAIASRQARIFFLDADTDNMMRGFAAFENGFTFENNTTTCLFDAFFPISGDVVLNGGTLSMLRNLRFENPFTLSPGIIDAKNFTINFPDNAASVEIPSANHTKVLSYLDDEVIGQEVTSVDWSFDDKYIAVSSTSGINELKIYYFHDETLTLTLSKDFGSTDITCLRWHPSDHYIAIGKSVGVELEIYYLNIATGTLESKGDFDAFELSALAWSPDGNYLAVGGVANSSFFVCAVSNGVIGNLYGGAFGQLRTVQGNSIDWNDDGDYIALGLETGVEKLEVQVFNFNGSSLTKSAEADLTGSAFSVKWMSGTDYLSVGYGASSERLVFYEHNSATGELIEKQSARVACGQTVYGLDWNHNGSFLAAAKVATTVSHELEIFTFNGSDVTFNLCAGYELGTGIHIKDVSWANNSNYIAVGDITGVLRVFSLVEKPLVFKNAKLFFKADVVFNGPVVFDGTCTVNGGGNSFYFENDGTLIVSSGSTLLLEDVILKGIEADSIACADSTAKLTLQDLIWFQDSNYTFSVGTMEWKNRVEMIGDSTFVYQSDQISTVLQRSTLWLDSGFTFSYDPVSSVSKNLLAFIDKTSVLFLHGATLHTTVTGLELSKGKMLIEDESFLSSELEFLDNGYVIDEGITLGTGVVDEDMACEISSGAKLTVAEGTLEYKNLLSSSWNMLNYLSTLHLAENTRFLLTESLDLGIGALHVNSQAYVERADGKDLVGSEFTVE